MLIILATVGKQIVFLNFKCIRYNKLQFEINKSSALNCYVWTPINLQHKLLVISVWCKRGKLITLSDIIKTNVKCRQLNKNTKPPTNEFYQTLLSYRPIIFSIRFAAPLYKNYISYIQKWGQQLTMLRHNLHTHRHMYMYNVMESQLMLTHYWRCLIDMNDKNQIASYKKLTQIYIIFRHFHPGLNGWSTVEMLKTPQIFIKSLYLLGIDIDDRLTFDGHVRNMCIKAGRQLNALQWLKGSLDKKNSRMAIYTSFIISNFNYCPIVWMFTSN